MALISGVKSMERKPCWVNGRKGLFHRYIDKTETVFISESLRHQKDIEAAKEYFDDTKIIPNGFRVDKIVTTYALIEFEDGHMEEIPPTTITFVDHSEFEGYDWRGEEKTCDNCIFAHLPSSAATPCYRCMGENGSGIHDCWVSMFTRK